MPYETEDEFRQALRDTFPNGALVGMEKLLDVLARGYALGVAQGGVSAPGVFASVTSVEPTETGTIEVGSDILASGSSSLLALWAQLFVGSTAQGARVQATAGSTSNWVARLPAPTQSGPHTVRVFAAQTGGDMLAESATFSVVNADDEAPPAIEAQAFSIAEGVETNRDVGTVQASGTGLNNFRITAGNAAGRFFINDATGEITTAAALDFETQQRSYPLTVMVDGQGASATGIITVNVTNVLEAPELLARTFEINDTATVGDLVGTMVAAPTSDPATSWQLTGGPFVISAGGAITVSGELTEASYALTVTGINAAGSSAAVTVTVNVADSSSAAVLAPMEFRGTGAPAGTIKYDLETAFAEGDVPEGATLSFVRADNDEILRTQMNVLTAHPDGSVKTAILPVELPELAPDVLLMTNMVRNAPHASPGSAINFATALSGRSASVTFTPVGGGTPATIDVIASVLASGESTFWRSGTLAAEKRVRVNVPSTALGGITSLDLVADVCILKDGSLWIDYQFRNDWATPGDSGSGAGNVTYGVTITQDGQQKFAQASLYHMSFCHLPRIFGTLPGGAAAPKRPYARHDIPYLAGRAKAVLPMDTRLPPLESRLVGFQTRITAPQSDPAQNWDAPWSTRNCRPNEGAAGGHETIGIMTDGQAAWLLTGDPRAQDYATGQAEAAGGSGRFHWQRTSTRYGAGGAWLNPWDHPNAVIGFNPYFPPTAPSFAPTPIRPAASHGGSYFYIPALLTGRRWFHDALAAHVSWNVMSAAGGTIGRGVAVDYDTGEGVNQVRNVQVRSYAWRTREAYRAGYLVPDADPQKELFDGIARGNANFLVNIYPSWKTMIGPLYGFNPLNINGADQFSNWQQDYFLISTVDGLRLGYSQLAEYITEYALNHVAGRFLQDPAVFPPIQGYKPDLFIGPSPGQYWQSWLAFWEAIQARGPVGADTGPVDPITETVTLADQRVTANVFGVLREEFPHNADIARAWDYTSRRTLAGNASVDKHREWVRYNMTSIRPWATRLDTVPTTIAPGQTLSFREDTASRVLGVVAVAGHFRHTSLSIVGGTAQALVVIDRAGVVEMAPGVTAANFNLDSYTLQVAVEGSNSPVSIGTVAITVGRMAAPTLAPQSFEIAENALTDVPVGTVVVGGDSPTLTIVGGNTGNAFKMVGFEIVVANGGALSGPYSLTLRASNLRSSVDAVMTVTTTTAALSPAVAAQTVSVEDGFAIGETVATMVNTGGAVTGWTIPTNPGGRFAISSSGVVTAAAPLLRSEAVQNVATVRATGPGGTVDAILTVNVTQVAYAVVLEPESTVVAVYDMSRLWRPTYAGPLFRAIRSDNVEQDFSPDGDDFVLPATVLAWAGGLGWDIHTLYDHSPRANHLAFASSFGRPIGGLAGGTAITIGSNNRLAMRVGGNTGIRGQITLPAGTALAAVAAVRATASGGAERDTIVGLAATETGDDGATATSLRMFRSNAGLLTGTRSATSVPPSGALTTNASRFAAYVTSNEADWHRRLIVGTNQNGVNTGTWGALNSTAWLRIGHNGAAGALSTHGFIGEIGTVMLFGAVNKALDIGRIRDDFTTHHGLT